MDATDHDAQATGEPTAPGGHEAIDVPIRGRRGDGARAAARAAGGAGRSGRSERPSSTPSGSGSRPGRRDLRRVLRDRGAVDDRRLDLLRALARATLEQNGDDPARAIAALDPPGSTILALRRVADDDVRSTLSDVRKRPSAVSHRPGPGVDDRREGPRRRPPTPRALPLGRPPRSVSDPRRFHAKGGSARSPGRDRRRGNRPPGRIQGDPRGPLRRPREPCGVRSTKPRSPAKTSSTRGSCRSTGFGRDDDGRPYCAMRFVRGQTLDGAIAEFHGPGGPAVRGAGRAAGDPGLLLPVHRRLQRRRVRPLQGVIPHRDLKPSNILLGPHGRDGSSSTGASLQSRPAGPRGPPPGGEETIRPSSGSELPCGEPIRID